VKEPNWPGYPSSVGTPASVSHIIAEGHVFCGLAPTVAETLREPLAILEQRSIVREFNERLEHKDVLLRVQAHRFANSLQIIASTLLTKSALAKHIDAIVEIHRGTSGRTVSITHAELKFP